MRARLQRFLLLCLMLVLPLQGFASATMLGCTFSHEAVNEPMAMDDGMMAGCHESEPNPVPAPASHDCQHCAICALGAVLPVPIIGMPALPPLTGYASRPAAVFSGFVPDGPERPPRSFFA